MLLICPPAFSWLFVFMICFLNGSFRGSCLHLWLESDAVDLSAGFHAGFSLHICAPRMWSWLDAGEFAAGFHAGSGLHVLRPLIPVC